MADLPPLQLEDLMKLESFPTAPEVALEVLRLSRDPETRAYADRREHEGLSHREIVRCLKRYLARRLYPIILADLAKLT